VLLTDGPMTPEGIFSTLLDRVVQGSAGALAGVVCGVAVTAYITSAAYIALRAGYERNLIMAVSKFLEATLQTRNASASASHDLQRRPDGTGLS